MRLMREAQRLTINRDGKDGVLILDKKGTEMRAAKDVYSVPSHCGILLLNGVAEEMDRARVSALVKESEGDGKCEEKCEEQLETKENGNTPNCSAPGSPGPNLL